MAILEEIRNILALSMCASLITQGAVLYWFRRVPYLREKLDDRGVFQDKSVDRQNCINSDNPFLKFGLVARICDFFFGEMTIVTLGWCQAAKRNSLWALVLFYFTSICNHFGLSLIFDIELIALSQCSST